MGRVRLVGASIDAPFSGRRVCYYNARCFHQDNHPYNDDPTPSVEEKRACDFRVEDGTGTALIRVDSGASFETMSTVVSNVPEERTRAFLDRLRHHSDDHERWVPEEWVLEEGAIVSVYGVGEWEPDPAPGPRWQPMGYREAPRRLVMRAPDGLHLFVSERPIELEPMFFSR